MSRTTRCRPSSSATSSTTDNGPSNVRSVRTGKRASAARSFRLTGGPSWCDRSARCSSVEGSATSTPCSLPGSERRRHRLRVAIRDPAAPGGAPLRRRRRPGGPVRSGSAASPADALGRAWGRSCRLRGLNCRRRTNRRCTGCRVRSRLASSRCGSRTPRRPSSPTGTASAVCGRSVSSGSPDTRCGSGRRLRCGGCLRCPGAPGPAVRRSICAKSKSPEDSR